MSWRRSMYRMLDTVDDLVIQQLARKGQGPTPAPHASCIDWVIECSRIHDSREIGRELLSFIFASGFHADGESVL